jgi:hypothetical protein
VPGFLAVLVDDDDDQVRSVACDILLGRKVRAVLDE